MIYEIQNADTIDFLKEKPVSNIGDRKFYKCKFKKTSVKKSSSLKYTDLYYITKDHNEINNGAYLTVMFDKKRENLLFLEYLRKPNDDMESVEYAILGFIKKMNYDISILERSKDGFKYFNNNLL